MMFLDAIIDDDTSGEVDKVTNKSFVKTFGRVPFMLVSVYVAILASSGALCAPVVTNVTTSGTSVGLYEKFEITFDVETVATNPFWPYDEQPNPGVPARVGVSVDGLFLPPGETGWENAIVQPGFFFQDFEYRDIESGGNHYDWLYPKGFPCWKIRFAPTALGEWRFRIRVIDASGTTLHVPTVDTFTCVRSSERGFVRVSERDCRYFETSDGSYLNLLGVHKRGGSTFTKRKFFEIAGKHGINLIRTWWQGSEEPVLFGLSGQGGIPSYGGTFSVTTEVTRPGQLFSGKIVGNGTVSTSASVKPSTRYKFSAWVKTVNLVGPPGSGVHLRVFPCVEGDVPLTQSLNGDTDWTQLSAFVTSRSDQYSMNWIKIVVTGVESGATYFTDLSLREVLPNGGLGPELLSKPNFNCHQYISLLEAYRADLEVEDAKANGIYLKVVLQEKQDAIFPRIQSDGSAGDASPNNFYAWATHACRTYQQYFWRYVIARYGYATNIHSFELCNEGDPFNGYHVGALEAFSAFFATHDPNKHLCTTSNWHSYPTSEMWGNCPSAGYTDWHMYVGKQTGSNLNYVLGWENKVYEMLDETTFRSPPRSLHITGTGQSEGIVCSHPIPIEPGHEYTFSWYVKGNVSTTPYTPLSWQFPTICFGFKTGHRGFGTGRYYIPGENEKLLGEFDWTFRTFTVTAPLDAHYVEVLPSLHWCAGEVWFDDITMVDNTTGQVIGIPNGNFDAPMKGRLDYDTVAMVCSLGAQAGDATRRHIKKPIIRGESGISGDKKQDFIERDGYRYGFTGESQDLVYDDEGVWYRKFIWAHIAPFGLIDMYWWTSNIMNKGLYIYAKAYQNFMSGIPLSNGHYRDVQAETTNPNIRVLGQKDPVNNRAHIWIDNAPYTWKAVVDHNYRPEPWSSSVTYAKGSTCGAGNPMRIYRSLQDNNKNHPVTDTEWWEDLGEFNPANNPPLPPPVSGNVIISGLADGVYQVEWWNTSTGSVIRTERVECKNGKITLTVENLVSDIACKLALAPPELSIRLTVIEGRIAPGNEVTVAVDFTNIGSNEALNAEVTARVPAEMDYVAGSAEATGGVYNPAEKTITWIVDKIAPGETGRRLFKAVVH